MRPIFQTKFTNESIGKRGNCLAACLASLVGVGIEHVPQFEEMEDEILHNSVLKFLTTHGFEYCGSGGGLPPKDNRYYLVSFVTPFSNQIRHMVIVRNGKIVHDPRMPSIPLTTPSWYPIIKRRKPCQPS